MKLLFILYILVVLIFNSCPSFFEDDINPNLRIIDGFTLDNYPRVDGSTSTEPLNTLIACKLLGIRYQWVKTPYGGPWRIEPIFRSNNNSSNFSQLIRSSQTHNSFINLINGQADIILSARKMSDDEKALANTAGVGLIETPIALDAFIFIVHSNNPITNLTIGQIQNIYMGKINNWNEIGGNDRQINPYVRNPNSGSQELMESLIMKDIRFMDFPVSPEVIFTMGGVFDIISSDIDGICYTVYYYKEHILRDTTAKSIAINGIHPTNESIRNRLYPLVAEVYVVIRSDLEPSSMAYKLYEFLQTELGKEVIRESGYIPF